MSINIADLIANIYAFLHATSESDAIFVDDAELERKIADLLSDLAIEYGLFIERDNSFITLADGTQMYGLPPRHLSTLHVALNGKPLIASSTAELERLDANFGTTSETATVRPGPVKRWAQDKQGFNNITFYPVPAAGISAGLKPEIIYFQYPCSADEDIDTPKIIGDLLEIMVLENSYKKESDFSCPEIAQACGALAGLYFAQIANLWRQSQ